MSDQSPKIASNRSCLICGIRTTQLVNIFDEGRSGPKLVDVIYEKYKFRAEQDKDKFLCYACNNWLINWWSLQANKNEVASSQASASPSKHERNRNGGRYVNKTNKENHQSGVVVEQVAVKEGKKAAVAMKVLQEVDLNGCETENGKLEDGMKDCVAIIAEMKQKNYLYRKKYKCFYCNKKFRNWIHRRHHSRLVHPKSKSSSSTAAPTTILDARIVEMLRKQGTLLVREDQLAQVKAEWTVNHRPSQSNQHQAAEEIVLSFDRVISEAIPQWALLATP